MNTCKTCGRLLPSEPDEQIFGERCNCFNVADSGLTSIEQLVAEDIADRQRKGIKKYGVTVAENPLPLKAWLQHAYEESLDLPIYIKKSIIEIEERERLQEMAPSALVSEVESLKLANTKMKDVIQRLDYIYRPQMSDRPATRMMIDAVLEKSPAVADRTLQSDWETGDACGCIQCYRARTAACGGLPFEQRYMIVCPLCGNKRCPHASNHELACTGSNEPGQPGSVY